MSWAPELTLAQLSTHRLLATPSALFRSLLTCYGLLFLGFGGHWELFLPLAEFTCNNSYHSSIQISSFEYLYGRRCPLSCALV